MIIIKDLIIYNKLKNKILVKINELLITEKSIFIIKADSGKGKTVFLKTLANEYHYWAGNILINNKIFEAYTESTFFKIIQFVSQSYPLFNNMTVYQQLVNVLLHIKNESLLIAEEKIINILNKFNLLEQKDKYPSGLSGGQRQRIAIIQKIILKPDYLVLDEPTSGLDQTSKFEVLNYLLDENKQGMGIIISSHDSETINFFKEKTLYLL